LISAIGKTPMSRLEMVLALLFFLRERLVGAWKLFPLPEAVYGGR